MALVTERIATIHEDWLTVDVTYDDVTERVERILVTCNAPQAINVQLFKGGNYNSPWREATMNDGETYDESRPFGGGFRDLSDLQGQAYSWSLD